MKLSFPTKTSATLLPQTEAPKILKEMQDRFLDKAPGYFGHPDFAARFIRGKFVEKQALQRWQRLDTRHERQFMTDKAPCLACRHFWPALTPQQ